MASFLGSEQDITSQKAKILEEIEKIKKETGIDFNSGYTSDPMTQKYVHRRKDYPALEPYLRTRWSTLRVEKQKTLAEFEAGEEKQG